MGCAFIKLCPEWSGYKTAGRIATPPALESSPLLKDDNMKQTALSTSTQHLYQTAHCMLNEAAQANDGNAMEQSAIMKDQSLIFEQEQPLQLPVMSAENINESLEGGNISETNIPSLVSFTSSLTSDCPSISQAERAPDILDKTVANGCNEDVIPFVENISTQALGTSATSSVENCHFPEFHIEQVLKEYQALVEECAILRTRVQTVEAEIEIERTRKSEQLDSLQRQFAEMASEYHILQNKSNLMLLASGIPLLVLVFAVLLVIYPVHGAVTSASS